MPISVFVEQTTSSCEWAETMGEAWDVGPGTASYVPTITFESSSGELGLLVNGPWTADLNISSIRVTFTGSSSINLNVYPTTASPTSFNPYTSGEEVSLNAIDSSDPLFGLFMVNNEAGEFQVTSIEMCIEPPEPIDPTTLECTDYTDEIFWDSANTVGTYVDPNWISVNSGGDDYVSLVPWGITTWGSGWNEGYQPQYARIFFTGPSTVDVLMKQKESGGFEDFLISEQGYSSGDVLLLEGSYFDPIFRISNIYIGNSPGTGTITVTGISLCYGPLVCQEKNDITEAMVTPDKFPAQNEVVTLSIMPGYYGGLQYYPFADLTGLSQFTYYPITVTSADANNFRMRAYNSNGLAYDVSTTNGSLEGFVLCEQSIYGPPINIVIQNQEIGSECDTFNVRFGSDVQDYATSGPALADPLLTLTDATLPFIGGESRYLQVGFTVAPNRMSAIYYTQYSGGGYDLTVQSHNGASDEFQITFWDGNMANPQNVLSSGGEAVIYVSEVVTPGFYIVVTQFNSNGRRSDFTIYYPQPF